MSLLAPENLVLPAALAAAAAYLDARYFISYDVGFIWHIVRVAVAQKRLERSGRHNYFYVLEENALNPRLAGNPCLIFEGKQWTYKEVYDLVLSYGAWLKTEYNVQKDEVIALDCMNRPNFIFIWFGLWSIGARAALINYNLTDKPLLHSVKSSTARLLLVDEEVRPCVPPHIVRELESPDFHDGKGGVKVVFFPDSLEQQVASIKGARQPDSARSVTDGASMSMLIFTSGTTGLPKPATIPWNKINGVKAFVPGWLKLTRTDRFYTCMPLYHSAGAILATCVAMGTGCTLVLGKKFSTKTFWPEVRESKATIIQYVGETCRYLLAAQPSSLDKANCVRMAFGNGLGRDIWQRFKDRFDIPQINEFYAATEGVGGSWNRSRNDFSAGAIGRSGKLLRLLFGGRSILVSHDHTTGEPYRDPATGFCTRINTSKKGSSPGELLHRLPDEAQERMEAFPGYYNNDSATSSKILRDVLIKGDAYFRTGDMVRIDQEGRTYFHDRIGDTFRWKSENVSTNEVAEALGRHPEVVEANVYGVQVPHHDGRAGCAAIILRGPNDKVKIDSTEIDASSLSSLAQHSKDTLPRYAVPVFLRLTSSMETTGTNKQSKVGLREDGVDPEKARSRGDRIFWLRDGTYKPFSDQEWEQVKAGKVKL